MIRRFYGWLPGPPTVRIAVMLVIFIVAVILLLILFERAGDLLDDGGVIGPTSLP